MNIVTIFDPDSGIYREIPESELAPGMVRVQIEGREGVVWVELGKLNHSDFRHPPFTGDRRDKIYRIRDAFPDIYDKSYEFWEDGFRRDENPDTEIAIWLVIADVYSTFAKGRPLEERSEIFSLVIACSNSGRDQVKNVFNASFLSDSEVDVIISRYFSS